MGSVMENKLPIIPDSGFSFDNCTRNLILEQTGLTAPRAVSTGTTIVGAKFKDGVVVAADSRATEGNIIADKNCNKLHKLTNSMYACGAGTAADLDQVTNMLSSQLKLQELNTGRKATMISALRHAKQYLFRYMGYVGAYLLIGGVDDYGPELYTVHAHGSTTQGPFEAEGSGSLNAISVLEMGFKADMTKDECVELVLNALKAGMHGDLASGNSMRYAIITKDSTQTFENVKPDFTKSAEKGVIKFVPRVTKVFNESEKEIVKAQIKGTKFDVVQEMEVN